MATGSWSWETMQGMGFDRGGSWGLEGYPVSLMGSIALARQTLMDATHHQAAHERWMTRSTAGPRPPQSDAMVALAPILSARQSVLFDTKDEVNAARAHALAEEFELDVVCSAPAMSSGDWMTSLPWAGSLCCQSTSRMPRWFEMPKKQIRCRCET